MIHPDPGPRKQFETPLTRRASTLAARASPPRRALHRGQVSAGGRPTPLLGKFCMALDRHAPQPPTPHPRGSFVNPDADPRRACDRGLKLNSKVDASVFTSPFWPPEHVTTPLSGGCQVDRDPRLATSSQRRARLRRTAGWSLMWGPARDGSLQLTAPARRRGCRTPEVGTQRRVAGRPTLREVG